jgi:hypothetical protein
VIFRVNKLIYQRVIPNITLTWLVTLGVDVIGFLVRFPGDDSAACACLWLMGFTLPAVGTLMDTMKSRGLMSFGSSKTSNSAEK